jgi:limonene-1,2-epoxide hydrolase
VRDVTQPALTDFLPHILRLHFDTEASHAGLRSPDLARTGGRSASTPDAGAVARAARRAPVDHARVRRALQALSSAHAETLVLAFGVTLRNRDIDDTSRRRAPRAAERSWRVQLAELYGIEGAVVLASPKARRLFEQHLQGHAETAADALPALEERVAAGRPREDQARLQSVLPGDARDALATYEQGKAGGLIAWLIGPGKAHVHIIATDAKRVRAEALDAFGKAYGVSAKSVKRSRDMGKTRARILAFHTEHGQIIGT